MTEINCSNGEDIKNVQQEQKTTSTPNNGSKKAKLNDGSSRDVVQHHITVKNVKDLMYPKNVKENVVDAIIISDDEEENVVKETTITPKKKVVIKKLTRGESMYRIMKRRVRLDSEDEQMIRDLLVAEREERNFFREAYGRCDFDESSIEEEVTDSNDEDNYNDDPMSKDNKGQHYVEVPVMEEKAIEYPIIEDKEVKNIISEPVIEVEDEENFLNDLVIADNDEENDIKHPMVKDIKEENATAHPVIEDIKENNTIEYPKIEAIKVENAIGDPVNKDIKVENVIENPAIKDIKEEYSIEIPVIEDDDDDNDIEALVIDETAINEITEEHEDENIIEVPIIEENDEGNFIEVPVISDTEEQNINVELMMEDNEDESDIEDPVIGDDERQNILEGPMIIDSDDDNCVEETVIIDTEEENVAEQTVITDHEFDIFNEITQLPGDDWLAGGSEDPINEIVIMTPSTSAQALLMDMQAPSTSSSYRNGGIPDRGLDDSSLDESDDLSPADNYLLPRSATDFESDYNNGTIYLGTSSSEDDEEPLDNSDELSEDDDEDEEGWSRSNEDTFSDEGANEDTPPVLLKQKPKHNYNILKEVLNREIGLTTSTGVTMRDDVVFAQRFYSSLHAVFRMEKVHSLSKHRGCVNSLNFHPEGHLLASGSDDTTVIIWDWARKISLHTVKTGHKSNVFQSKFLNFNSSSQLNIVTCARDGHVRLAQCGSAGGSWSRRRLAAHGKAANKLHVTPLEPHSVLSAGEDGFVLHCDLRVDTVNKVIQVKERNAAVALYSLHGHPFDSKQLVVAGRDKFVRVYDRRKSNKPAAIYCPSALTEQSHDIKKTMRLSAIHLTCALYNHDGTEILASYSDDDIYLFNTKTDIFSKDDFKKMKEGYSLRFSGHRNSATLKSVSFFGPKSEYVISGSDCGHIYIWDKQTESIVQWRQGDANGMVNIIEAHPHFPILASGGLDKDVKIWAPYGTEDPNYHGLSSTIRLNTATNWQSPLFNDFLPTLYRSWRGDNRILVETEDLPYAGNYEFEANNCTTF